MDSVLIKLILLSNIISLPTRNPFCCVHWIIVVFCEHLIIALKDELPRWVGDQYNTKDQCIIITPERMKGWSQSKNNTQLWMGLVIVSRPDAIKSNIA